MLTRFVLRFAAAAVLLCVSLLVAPALAQEFDDEESPRRPGLIATYSAAGAEPFVRIDESVAFDWQDAAPDPRLPAGSFSALWRGRLWIQSPGTHRLAVFVQGDVALKLGGKAVLAGNAPEPKWLASQPLEMEFDYHPLEITYKRTGPKGRLALFWLGPNFVLEPVPGRFLFHDRAESPSQAFEFGRQLAAALRCTACHREKGQSGDAMPAPALDRLSGNIEREWLVEWLAAERKEESGIRGQESDGEAIAPTIVRRMPHFGLTKDEAQAIAAWLLRLPAERGREIEQKDAKNAKGKKDSKPSSEQGERLFLTLGCLACHQHGVLGESGLFGGGDVTRIAAKRPAEFFARWLADPASLNKQHRMPVFELSADERSSLALWLAKQGAVGNALRGVPKRPIDSPSPAIATGASLIARFRCAACHTLPAADEPTRAKFASPLTAASDWSRTCAAAADAKSNRPGYELAIDQQAALQAYFSAGRPSGSQPSPQAAGRDLLVQLNCLACHQREGIDRQTSALPARLQDKLAALAELHSDLAKEVPAMTPPALNSVGDKLHDQALANAIRRQGDPHRPYMLARMPKFNLSDNQLAALTSYLTSTDRIPSIPSELAASIQNPKSKIQNPPPAALAAAGPRLVTADGFSCTSCHQIGGVLPDKAPLNARGPDISMLEKRIRREWFDRWCYSPARIVPRMEMPSVQVPVRGVLSDNINDQLAAVWHTLNTPGFQPPEPNPIRVLRLAGVPERKESPIVLHDIVKDGDKTYLFPLVIGLPNRHNILFDLETNRLAAWWLGDTARQRTKGKSWLWELGGKSLMTSGSKASALSIIVDGKEYYPSLVQQHTSKLDSIHRPINELERGRVEWWHRLYFEIPIPHDQHKTQTVSLFIRESVHPLNPELRHGRTGFIRRIATRATAPMDAVVRFHCLPVDAVQSADKRNLNVRSTDNLIIEVVDQEMLEWKQQQSDFVLEARLHSAAPVAEFILCYQTVLTGDRYEQPRPPVIPVESISVAVAPGFNSIRLPLPDSITPTAIAWNPQGKLILSTLKGELLVGTDSNDDGLEDSLSCLADGLATPYGIAGDTHHVDVLSKSGLFRLENDDWTRRGGLYSIGEDDEDGPSQHFNLIAAGWGVTDDYHDWAVGLVRGEDGEYYIGLPCQQDKRSDAAAKHRGQILRLVPRKPTPDNPREFGNEVLSSGHRFPMGLAMNRAGDLFVTDNQGNYNPFNELNHVRPGKHFGFINANEKEAGFKPPPLEEPAINIPHPWTRSVNGICFLDTPDALLQTGQENHFGPLEGHLIGCEYDTRRLIRMTLQKIGDTYQGAAYPLSIPPDDVEKGLLGPIVCAVSPRGELYVGEIRDSGWGAGNNIGQIVKIKIEPEKLPCGIAEMRATADGFTLDFFQPVDQGKAANIANYSLQSYRRESTPAYGGPDLDRRTEKITSVEVAPDKKRVTLKLGELRERFVYELRLKNLAPKGAMFHPDEAHFTLRQIPE